MDPYAGSIYTGVVRVIMSIVSLWMLKRYKRRMLLMVSIIVMAACIFISGLSTIWIKQGASDLSLVPLICLLIYICASMIGNLNVFDIEISQNL